MFLKGVTCAALIATILMGSGCGGYSRVKPEGKLSGNSKVKYRDSVLVLFSRPIFKAKAEVLGEHHQYKWDGAWMGFNFAEFSADVRSQVAAKNANLFLANVLNMGFICYNAACSLSGVNLKGPILYTPEIPTLFGGFKKLASRFPGTQLYDDEINQIISNQ